MEITILIKKLRLQLIFETENEYDKEVLKILEKLPNTHRTKFYAAQDSFTCLGSGEEDLLIVFDNVG